jgi:hypothetical protein
MTECVAAFVIVAYLDIMVLDCLENGARSWEAKEVGFSEHLGTSTGSPNPQYVSSKPDSGWTPGTAATTIGEESEEEEEEDTVTTRSAMDEEYEAREEDVSVTSDRASGASGERGKSEDSAIGEDTPIKGNVPRKMDFPSLKPEDDAESSSYEDQGGLSRTGAGSLITREASSRGDDESMQYYRRSSKVKFSETSTTRERRGNDLCIGTASDAHQVHSDQPTEDIPTRLQDLVEIQDAMQGFWYMIIVTSSLQRIKWPNCAGKIMKTLLQQSKECIGASALLSDTEQQPPSKLGIGQKSSLESSL